MSDDIAVSIQFRSLNGNPGRWKISIVNPYDSKSAFDLAPEDAVELALELIKSAQEVAKRQAKEPKKEQR